MDEFRRGTPEYDEAHGLYIKRGRLSVVSPGDKVPSRARRLGSVAHPGVERERLAAGERPTLSPRHFGITGAGQGCDISEFQGSLPGGFSFYITRLVNENNREDSHWRSHKNSIDALGVPAGAYGIIRPGNADPTQWANHFADLLGQSSWALIPTIDVELGDPNACRSFCATATSVLKARGWSAIMGYFSTGSAYRQTTQDLFDARWGACWGCGYPAGFQVHQWQGSPLDRDYCPDFAAISTGGGPAPTPPPPRPKEEGMLGISDPAQGGDGNAWHFGVGYAHSISGNPTAYNELKFVGNADLGPVHPLTLIHWMQNYDAWDYDAKAPRRSELIGSGSGLPGPAGPEGPAGPAGPQGPPGDGGKTGPFPVAISGTGTATPS